MLQPPEASHDVTSKSKLRENSALRLNGPLPYLLLAIDDNNAGLPGLEEGRVLRSEPIGYLICAVMTRNFNERSYSSVHYHRSD